MEVRHSYAGQITHLKRLSKIVWSEGMHLGPHHFQAQASFFENALQFTASALYSNTFGFTGLELSNEALRNGTIALMHGRGVMPDGLVFQIPESDPHPEPRRAADVFPATANQLTLKLALPAHKWGGPNCAIEANGSKGAMRYVAAELQVADENTGFEEKPVRVGRKNFRLQFENEPEEGVVSLPIGRVMRDGAGGFRYDETFIPPCLKITASLRLMEMLGRLVQLLTDKSSLLTATARGRNRIAAGMSPQQVATFWFLHAINAGLAPLRQIFLSQHGHPEELFIEMLRLGGALCTFAVDAHPRTLPRYDHMNLTDSFEPLDRQIRMLLEFMIPTNCLSIELSPGEPNFLEGAVNDARALGPARWIFGIQSSLGEGELIRLTPKLAKLCSSQFTPELVRRALPGMTLTHLSTPPSAISPRVDWQYFTVERGGPCWEHILHTKRVSVYIPADIPEAKAEILVVLES